MMKNILLIIPSSKGTISKVSYNIYKALRNRNDVNIFVANLYDNGPCDYDKENMYIFKSGFANNIRKIFFLKKLKRELSIDISISTLIACNTLNVLSNQGEKTIGIFHAPLDQYKSQNPIVYFFCMLSYKYLYNRLDRLFAVSKSNQDNVQKFVKKTVELVYNIHDFDNISKLSEVELSAEEQVIFSKPTILYTGRLNELKGASRLLSAFYLYKSNHPESDVNLVFVGGDQKGDMPVEYIEKSKNLGIENQCKFLGWQTNPYKYMKHCTIFVSPSHSEGLPGVLIESLYLGKKVISTNSSKGVWEILQCYDNYIESLDVAYKSDLGIITPNLSDNENLNIRVLAEAIHECILDNDLRGDFDSNRFKAEVLVNYYTFD